MTTEPTDAAKLASILRTEFSYDACNFLLAHMFRGALGLPDLSYYRPEYREAIYKHAHNLRARFAFPLMKLVMANNLALSNDNLARFVNAVCAVSAMLVHGAGLTLSQGASGDNCPNGIDGPESLGALRKNSGVADQAGSPAGPARGSGVAADERNSTAGSSGVSPQRPVDSSRADGEHDPALTRRGGRYKPNAVQPAVEQVGNGPAVKNPIVDLTPTPPPPILNLETQVAGGHTVEPSLPASAFASQQTSSLPSSSGLPASRQEPSDESQEAPVLAPASQRSVEIEMQDGTKMILLPDTAGLNARPDAESRNPNVIHRQPWTNRLAKYGAPTSGDELSKLTDTPMKP